MTTRKYIKYTYSGQLQPGDIVELNDDGVPYVYEGLEGVVNTVPLCANNVDDLPIYDSCSHFLSANNRESEITRHEYAEKDYSTDNIPVSAFDRIYINPDPTRDVGDIICMNGKQYMKTGGTGTATHLLSAIPKTCELSSSVLMDRELPVPNLGGGSVADPTPSPTPSPPAGTNPTPTPTPSAPVSTVPTPSITPTVTPSTTPPTTYTGG